MTTLPAVLLAQLSLTGIHGFWVLLGDLAQEKQVLKHLRNENLVPNCAVIDCDDIRSHLPEWDRALKRAEKADTHKKALIMKAARDATQVLASAIAKKAVDLCIESRRSFIYDSTLRKKESAVAMFENCRLRGYRVGIVLVDTHLEVCQKRVESRQLATGRPVQPDFVVSCNKDSRETAEHLKDDVDLFISVDNNDKPNVCDDVKALLRQFSGVVKRSVNVGVQTHASSEFQQPDAAWQFDVIKPGRWLLTL